MGRDLDALRPPDDASMVLSRTGLAPRGDALARLLRPHVRWLVPTLALVVFVLALYARLLFARLAEHPGHADEAFYYTVAENLTDGRGFVIDYVWHYLAPPESITHPSNDYWLPLASVLMSASLLAFGKSVFAALLPGIAAGLALAPLLYAWSRLGSASTVVALGAAGLALFEPNLFAASLATATIVYFALLASASLYSVSRGRTDPRFFLLAAATAGLAHLTRHDGILLLGVLAVMIGLSPYDRSTRLRYGVLSLLVYGLVLSPWLWLNLSTLGSPFPPGSLQILFVTDYEDRYAFTRHASFGAYFAQGAWTILRAKVEAAGWNLKTLGYLGGLLWIPAAVAAGEGLLRRDRRPALFHHVPALMFLGALLAFHTLMPFAFALVNSAVAILPVLILLAVETLRRHVRSTAIVALILLGLGAHYYGEAFRQAGTFVAVNNDVGRQLRRLRELVARDPRPIPSGEVVIMTRIPWEVYLATRYKAVQIPNDDLPTILTVARRYRANYLLLPAERKALAGLYEGTLRDPRFETVGSIPYSDPFLGPYDHLTLFRIAIPP